MRQAAAVFVVLLLSACDGAGRPPQFSSVVTQEAVSPDTTTPVSADSLRDDLVEHGLLVPESRDSVLARFGKPDSVLSRPEMNRHMPGLTDSLVDLFYPGLHLRYYLAMANGRQFLLSANVSNEHYLKYPALGPGKPASRIITALGEPSERSDSAYTYDCARCIGMESPVHFHLRRGVVKSVEFTAYVD